MELINIRAAAQRRDPHVTRAPQSVQIADAVTIAVLARIQGSIAVDIQAHVQLDLVVVRHAVLIAIFLTRIGHIVAVQIPG